MKVASIRSRAKAPASVSPATEAGGLKGIELVVGIIVSMATAFIAWQTYRLSETTQQNADRLKAIEQELAQTRFSFERTREIYDRTEKYLTSSQQDEARGRVLLALINSIPESPLRTELLRVVADKATRGSIAARASREVLAATSGAKPQSEQGKQPTGPRPVPTSSPSQSASVPAQPTNGFSGPLEVVLNGDAYTATVLKDFSFTDSFRRRWDLPAGTVTTGSAVPRVFWSIVGAPLDGKTLAASALLEYHSSIRSATPEIVHRMYYEALLAGGVPEVTAKTLYTAVQNFGPRWTAKAPG